MPRCQTSSGMSTIGRLPPMTPALLCAKSRRPKVSTVFATIAATEAESATSTRTARALPPAFSIRETVCLAWSRSMSATEAPARASSMAVARPMPPAAPGRTRATRLEKSCWAMAEVFCHPPSPSSSAAGGAHRRDRPGSPLEGRPSAAPLSSPASPAWPSAGIRPCRPLPRESHRAPPATRSGSASPASWYSPETPSCTTSHASESLACPSARCSTRITAAHAAASSPQPRQTAADSRADAPQRRPRGLETATAARDTRARRRPRRTPSPASCAARPTPPRRPRYRTPESF